MTQQSANVYFLGKVISEEGNAVQVDRLGSVRSGGPGGLGHQAQYPYGVEYSATANDREKYATYTRDSVTGLDYAMNRYYTSQWGRFTSPDRSWKSANPRNPQSWDRYAYTRGDPANANDPSGLLLTAQDCIANPDACYGEDQGWLGDLYGGDGGACQDTTVSRFDPTPSPPGPNPCPSPDPPPPLECSFRSVVPGPPRTQAMLPGGGAASGYFLPITFNFFATGGWEDYSWYSNQTYNWAGYAAYSSGTVMNLAANNSEGPLPQCPNSVYNLMPGGVCIMDSPGLVSPTTLNGTASPPVSIVSAIVVFNYSLQASVTDTLTGQTAQCPTVWWQGWEIWSPGPNGHAVPSGADYLVQVTQP